MATLIQYLEEAELRDQEPGETCSTCGEPFMGGEPLGPYIIPKCNTCGRPFPGGPQTTAAPYVKSETPPQNVCGECGQPLYSDESNP